MKNFTLIAALTLCSFSWISASVSQSQTVEAQPGEGVTLQCNNNGEVIFWFRLVDRTEVSCVSVMIHSNEAKYFEGYQNGRFEMRSSNNIVSLKIHIVAKSDAGLYFCGFYTGGNFTFSVTRLNVKGSNEPPGDEDSGYKRESDGIAMLTSVILGALTVVLVLVIIGLVIKVRKLQTGTFSVTMSCCQWKFFYILSICWKIDQMFSFCHIALKENQNPEQHENVGRDDDVNYAAVTIRPKAKRRQQEPNVIYASTR
ncbi:uncharacterized protein LOC119027492 [Acanthopagrus latus]|uniref:uncharacterized protein LOC119027492 n=1 Tax=Acanthopagrus latus TaxID=8177 RepID=UPI00187BF5F0|nr:uncharacterized protein LOC119027492 [Acanthopagrus latus]